MKPSSPPAHVLATIPEASGTLLGGLLSWIFAVGMAQSMSFALTDMFHGKLSDLSYYGYGRCITDYLMGGFFGFPFLCGGLFLTVIGAPLVLVHPYLIYAFLNSGMTTMRLIFWSGMNQALISMIASLVIDGVHWAIVASFALTAIIISGAYLLVKAVREP